jgi:hypothetical protein
MVTSVFATYESAPGPGAWHGPSSAARRGAAR